MADAADADRFIVRADVYDLLIDWPRRLANETPFFQDLFARVGVRCVLDVACGTGRHVAMFHQWGLEAEGADCSADMLRRCRAQFGEPAGMRWVHRTFERPATRPGGFDAVVCIGNSLSLAQDEAASDRAVAAMIESLRPGGVGVVQVLNLWSIAEGATTWQKFRHVPGPDGATVILKGIHRCGGRGYVDVIHLVVRPDSLDPHYETPSFRGMEAAELVRVIEAAGGERLETYGSYQRAPYARESSADLIVVFRRADASIRP